MGVGVMQTWWVMGEIEIEWLKHSQKMKLSEIDLFVLWGRNSRIIQEQLLGFWLAYLKREMALFNETENTSFGWRPSVDFGFEVPFKHSNTNISLQCMELNMSLQIIADKFFCGSIPT